jgi:hypothetical protein
MSDPFPGKPVTQGQWRTVTGQLRWLGGDRVLEWDPNNGKYRLWRYDATSTGDPLPGDPLCEGTWSTIRGYHTLVYLGGDRVLDWVTGGWGSTPYRIWHFDRNVRGGDPFPGDPIVEGEWPTTNLCDPLIYLGGDRVMNFDTTSGFYQVFRYDRTVTGSVNPFVGPITSGTWQTVADSALTENHVLTSLDGGRVLETYLAKLHGGDQYRLWRFDPEAKGDPLPGDPIAAGTWNSVYPPLAYIGGDRVLQSLPYGHLPPIDYKVWNYSRGSMLVPGRSESWQIEAGVDDSVWAVGDAGHLYRWNGAQWVEPTNYARGVQVTVGDCDHIWHLNAVGQIWHYLGESWQQDPQIAALSIAAAADFTVWAILFDGRVMRRDGTVGATWSEPTPYARGVQIAVGNKDLVWHRNSLGEIWSWTGSGWTQIPGTALDIAVGADGTACRVSLDNRLFRWVGGQWLELPTDGRVAQVSVGAAGNIWYVNLDNHIFSWSGTQFGQRATLPV